MLGSILAPHPLRPDWILESHLAQKVDLDSIKRSVINTATASGDNDTSKRSENSAIIADENHLFEGSVKIDNFILIGCCTKELAAGRGMQFSWNLTSVEFTPQKIWPVAMLHDGLI